MRTILLSVVSHPGALLAAGALAVAATGSHYLVQVGITALLFSMFAVSLNLVTGSAGMLSLGHMALAGLGAYASSLIAMHGGWPWWLAAVSAGLLTSGVGCVLLLPSLRLSGIHFAVSTLAVAEIVLTIITNWVDLTRGPMGLRGIPRLNLLSWEGPDANLVVVGIAAVLTVSFVHALTRSDFGNALRALREDELSATALGIDVRALKVKAFAVSAFIAGLAGALMAHTTGFISPDSFRFGESVLVLAMCVLGGLGSVLGAAVGAVLLIALPEVLRDIGNFRMLLVGAALFVCIVFLPRGLLGETALRRLLRPRSANSPAPGVSP